MTINLTVKGVQLIVENSVQDSSEDYRKAHSALGTGGFADLERCDTMELCRIHRGQKRCECPLL